MNSILASIKDAWDACRFTFLYTSKLSGFHLLFCCFNRTVFSEDHAIVTIEIRRKGLCGPNQWSTRSAFKLFGFAIYENEVEIQTERKDDGN